MIKIFFVLLLTACFLLSKILSSKYLTLPLFLTSLFQLALYFQPHLATIESTSQLSLFSQLLLILPSSDVLYHVDEHLSYFCNYSQVLWSAATSFYAIIELVSSTVLVDLQHHHISCLYHQYNSLDCLSSFQPLTLIVWHIFLVNDLYLLLDFFIIFC